MAKGDGAAGHPEKPKENQPESDHQKTGQELGTEVWSYIQKHSDELAGSFNNSVKWLKEATDPKHQEQWEKDLRNGKFSHTSSGLDGRITTTNPDGSIDIYDSLSGKNSRVPAPEEPVKPDKPKTAPSDKTSKHKFTVKDGKVTKIQTESGELWKHSGKDEAGVPIWTNETPNIEKQGNYLATWKGTITLQDGKLIPDSTCQFLENHNKKQNR